MPVQREKQNVIALYQNFKFNFVKGEKLSYDKIKSFIYRRQFLLYKVYFHMV